MGYRVGGVHRAIALALGVTPLCVAGCTDRVIAEDGNGTGIEAGSTSGVPVGSSSGVATNPTTDTTGSGSTGADESTGAPFMPRVCLADGYPQVDLCYGEADDVQNCACDYDCRNRAIDVAYERYGSGFGCGFYVDGFACTELWQGQCCYTINVFEDACGKGRPLMVEGRSQVASLVPGCAWTDAAVLAEGAPEPTLGSHDRAPVAAHWQRAALDEHASVASFARFVLELIGVGAPASLLAEAAAAMHDEIQHAQLAFALAQRFGAQPQQPGVLAPPPSRPATLEQVLVATIVEGCVAETLAAAEAELAAARATDLAVVSALRRIADDEARHAGLAWRFVQWALAQAPHLRDAAARAFADAEALVVGPAHAELPGLEGYGLLSGADIETLRARTLQRTVRPYAAVLLVRAEASRVTTAL